jgi:hypothetical protein
MVNIFTNSVIELFGFCGTVITTNQYCCWFPAHLAAVITKIPAITNLETAYIDCFLSTHSTISRRRVKQELPLSLYLYVEYSILYLS